MGTTTDAKVDENNSTTNDVKTSENQYQPVVDPKITILRLELSSEMKVEAITKLTQILGSRINLIEKDIATDLKKHFDQKYGQTWHCIVGKGFGCSITYDTQFLLFFKADQLSVLLFKSME